MMYITTKRDPKFCYHAMGIEWEEPFVDDPSLPEDVCVACDAPLNKIYDEIAEYFGVGVVYIDFIEQVG